jgi:hypothetical protein
MTASECLDVATILLQLGLAFIAIPACLVASAMILLKLIYLLVEDRR